MLKKLLLSSIAATAMVGSALAADLPRRAPPPVYVPPPPVFTWQGFYVGVNGGALWTNSRDFVTTGTDLGSTFFPNWSSSAALAATNVVRVNNRAQGLVGGTWGYNWQFGALVLGTESDFEGVFGCRNNNNGSFFGNDNNTCGGTAIGIAAVGGGAPPGFSVLHQQTFRRSLDWLNTSRVRAGFLITPSFLIYGTGGFALGRVRVDSAIIASANPVFGRSGEPLAGVNFLSDSRLRAGFVGGGGLEWMFLPNWSLKAEALYYDLGRSHLDQLNQQIRLTVPGQLVTNTAIHTTFRNNGVIARAGINYHFHWFDAAPIAPVVARY